MEKTFVNQHLSEKYIFNSQIIDFSGNQKSLKTKNKIK